MKKNRIDFKIRLGTKVIPLGYLKWPCDVKYARLVEGGIAEVFEVGDTVATFSLEDIAVEDLWQDKKR